jgi:hypothetical protein
MGVKTSPDIFQRNMYELLGDIPNIQVYLNDILITSNGTFEEHAAIMEQVIDILQKANFRANLRKCYFSSCLPPNRGTMGLSTHRRSNGRSGTYFFN